VRERERVLELTLWTTAWKPLGKKTLKGQRHTCPWKKVKS